MKDKIRIGNILKMKAVGKKISALTAYDFTFSYLLDQSGIDIILVGDSCGNVCAGYETTIPVTMDEMIYHCKSVKRGVKRALLVGDMPFMSYQASEEDGLRNAGRLIKEGGVEAVKLEGGKPICRIIEKIVDVGIPVMGHLGLTPQSVHGYGGYSVRGKRTKEADQIKSDALALQKAGVFAIVLEKIPSQLAKEISKELDIPTIGIGAGKYCDGQILVTYDMLGLFDKMNLKFVRNYGNLAEEIRSSVKQYIEDVQTENFPSANESY